MDGSIYSVVGNDTARWSQQFPAHAQLEKPSPTVELFSQTQV